MLLPHYRFDPLPGEWRDRECKAHAPMSLHYLHYDDGRLSYRSHRVRADEDAFDDYFREADRIRETLSFYKKKSMLTVVNTALNLVFSRTIITSFTTMLVVLVLFFFGGEMIRGFAFALFIGIVVGTYSSIFIATPALIDLQRKQLETMRDEVIREEEEKKRNRKQKEQV
jgi:hypothetical protein